MYSYLLFLLILIPFIAFSAWASARVNAVFSQYDKIPTRAAMTGYDTAVRLMRRRGVNDVTVNRTGGRLTDHYHPSKREVNLSESTYGSASVAAVAVAAHEIGHVMQNKTHYVPYRIRSALVPVANVGSRLALPLILFGILFDVIFLTAGAFSVGQIFLYIGVGMYSLSTVFMLVTLPVEYNASRRAKKMLLEDGILETDEIAGASKVLSAAALTYVASLLLSLIYFLRLLTFVLPMMRRR